MGDSGQNELPRKSLTPLSRPVTDDVDDGWGDAIDAGWDDDEAPSTNVASEQAIHEADPVKAGGTFAKSAAPPSQRTAAAVPSARKSSGTRPSVAPRASDSGALRSDSPAPKSLASLTPRSAPVAPKAASRSRSPLPESGSRLTSGKASASESPESAPSVPLSVRGGTAKAEVIRPVAGSTKALASKPPESARPNASLSTTNASGATGAPPASRPPKSLPKPPPPPSSRSGALATDEPLLSSQLSAAQSRPSVAPAARAKPSEPPKSRPRGVASVPPGAASTTTPAVKLSDAPDLSELASADEPSDIGASAVALLSRAPDPAVLSAAPDPAVLSAAPDPAVLSAAPASSPSLAPNASAEAPVGDEPASLTPSVADLDVASAVQAARKGRRSRALLALAAVTIVGVGAGFAMYRQEGPSSMASKSLTAEATEPAAASPAPQSAAAPAIEQPAVAKPTPEAPPEGTSDAPSATAADFAAAFAAAPHPNAGNYSEVIVRVSPLGAQIYDGAKLLAQTAAKVRLAAGQKKTLVVHLEGHHSRKVFVDGSSDSVNIVLTPARGLAKPVEAADTTAAAPVERSFVVQSQQQRAAQPTPKAPKQEPPSADILPPL